MSTVVNLMTVFVMLGCLLILFRALGVEDEYKTVIGKWLDHQFPSMLVVVVVWLLGAAVQYYHWTMMLRDGLSVTRLGFVFLTSVAMVAGLYFERHVFKDEKTQ